MKKFTTLTLITTIGITSIFFSQCGSITKKTLISTGLGCGAGLALGII